MEDYPVVLGGLRCPECESSLQEVLEWNGASWKTLKEELCLKRFSHKTLVYGGEIYHMGGHMIGENLVSGNLVQR